MYGFEFAPRKKTGIFPKYDIWSGRNTALSVRCRYATVHVRITGKGRTGDAEDLSMELKNSGETALFWMKMSL